MEAILVKNVARSEDVRAFCDVTAGRYNTDMNVAFDSDVLSEIEGTIDTHTFG